MRTKNRLVRDQRANFYFTSPSHVVNVNWNELELLRWILYLPDREIVVISPNFLIFVTEDVISWAVLFPDPSFLLVPPAENLEM